MTRIAWLVPAVALAAGCAPDPQPSDLHPLTGTVTHRGKPVAAGGLMFAPEEGGWGGVIVNANVADGQFVAQTEKVSGAGTRAWPGAPARRYKVTYNPPGDGQATGRQCEIAGVVEVKAGGTVVDLVLPEADPKKADDPAKAGTPPTATSPPTGR